jgi:hypothetical protein
MNVLELDLKVTKDGTGLYALGEDGTNIFFLQIQPGHVNGVRTSDEDLKSIVSTFYTMFTTAKVLSTMTEDSDIDEIEAEFRRKRSKMISEEFIRVNMAAGSDVQTSERVKTLGDILREKMYDEALESDKLQCCESLKQWGHKPTCKETCATCMFFRTPKGLEVKPYTQPWCDNLKNAIACKHGMETLSLPSGEETKACKYHALPVHLNKK